MIPAKRPHVKWVTLSAAAVACLLLLIGVATLRKSPEQTVVTPPGTRVDVSQGGSKTPDTGAPPLETDTESLDAEAQKLELPDSAKPDPLEVMLESFYSNEDAVYNSVPRYAQVRDEMRRTAEGRLAQVPAGDTNAVLALANAALETFWEKGGLASADAYEHAYLARAMMEISVERVGENFALLSGLKDAMSAANPIYFAQRKGLNKSFYDEVWPIVQKQYELVVSGKVPPSPEAMLAVYDWATIAPVELVDFKAGLPGWEWLVDNADTGGWPNVKASFEKGLKAAKEGEFYCVALYSFPEARKYASRRSAEKSRALNLWAAKYGRRLESMKGPKELVGRRVPRWAESVE